MGGLPGILRFPCQNTRVSIDGSLVRTLNTWGEHHRTLIRICSSDLVYVVMLLAVLWFCAKMLQAHPLSHGWQELVRNLLAKSIIIFLIPVGIATTISELISAIYLRQRPFVVDSRIKLLVPHSADGGMPSHHIVFMSALIVTVFFYGRKTGIFLGLLTLLTGIARVAAGIHYPSDIIVGALIGAGVAYLYRWAFVNIFDQRRLRLN